MNKLSAFSFSGRYLLFAFEKCKLSHYVTSPRNTKLCYHCMKTGSDKAKVKALSAPRKISQKGVVVKLEGGLEVG